MPNNSHKGGCRKSRIGGGEQEIVTRAQTIPLPIAVKSLSANSNGQTREDLRGELFLYPLSRLFNERISVSSV